MIKGMLADCQKQFTAHMLNETGKEFSTELTICTDKFLTVEEGSEFGGVILYAQRRRIVVANTLLDRMNLVFEMMLPEIRSLLFNEPT
jgi:vacuolar-type H+-ATPase subunit E/Vma4